MSNSNDILKNAGRILQEIRDKNPGLDKQGILMVGHPRKSADDFPKDDTMSEPVPADCSKCGDPVWSTELKVELIKQSPNSLLLCGDCMIRMMQS